MTEQSSAITSVEITPGSEISVTTLKSDLAQLSNGPLPQEYKGMLTHIEETLPATKAACDNFYKSHSQMMTVTLDITDLTLSVVLNILLLRLRERRVLWQKHKSIAVRMISRFGKSSVRLMLLRMIWIVKSLRSR